MEPRAKRKPGNPNWVKGVSPNPSGKRTGKIEQLREIIDSIARERGEGEGAAEEVKIMMLAARGIMRDPHIPDSYIRVDSKTAAACAQWVAESYHGKPTQALAVDLSGAIEHRQTVDLGKLGHDELGALERLLEKSAIDEADQALTDLQEGELVPALSPGEPVSIISNVTPEKEGAP